MYAKNFVRAKEPFLEIWGPVGAQRGLKRPRSVRNQKPPPPRSADEEYLDALSRGGSGSGPPKLSSASSVSSPVALPGASASDGQGFFCETCQEIISSVGPQQHETSTLHLFNRKIRPQQNRKIQIHETNKGFQLLAGMGWNVDEGLGARKQGRVDPIKTAFKQDKAGLGAEKLRERVTHFPSHVPSEALNSSDGKSKAIRAQDELDPNKRRRAQALAGVAAGGDAGGVGGLTRKQKKRREEAAEGKERLMRFELLSDVPEEYAALFAPAARSSRLKR